MCELVKCGGNRDNTWAYFGYIRDIRYTRHMHTRYHGVTWPVQGPTVSRSWRHGGMAAWRPRKIHARSPCLSVAAVQCLSVAHITAPSDQQHLASFILRGRWPHARRRRGSDRSIAILLAPNSHSSAQTPTPSTAIHTHSLSHTLFPRTYTTETGPRRTIYNTPPSVRFDLQR